MVKCCSAIGCASRCLPNSKLKGLTFHVFPTDENIKRKWVLAMKRLDVNAAGIWEPKKGDVLCSRHFKKTDFDRSAPNIKLKPGVIPSIFDSPSHLQREKEAIDQLPPVCTLGIKPATWVCALMELNPPPFGVRGKAKNFIVGKTSPSKPFQSQTTITSLLVLPRVLKNFSPSSFLYPDSRGIFEAENYEFSVIMIANICKLPISIPSA
uniref:THAP domain containing 6 n=1 Tax=Molossus molossus TaxID=27622 RepID=A0A7J8K1U7_MOLMO|nr:THAP domain containing 6 [Molossus molossus]